ncbi:nitrate- and nitrite sensing domain-containing protein [Spirillospora sp. NPDC047279]|uniref:nitrate- and nitrite sensing domain-containing protein n=1 Tax=Spirillospora sp. NPDC047279 TaxID=3155478 RepID=UPI0033DE7880
MRITLLVLVPMLALIALWAFVTGITYGDARQLMVGKQFQDEVVLPTQDLLGSLQKERRLSMWQAGGDGARSADRAVLTVQRQATDKALSRIQRSAADSGLRGAILPKVRQRLDGFVTRMGALDAVRRSVDASAPERTRIMDEYNAMIDAGYGIYSSVAPANGTIATDARTLTTLGRAREFLSREDALLSGAIAAGRFTANERGAFAQLAGAQRYLYSDTAPNLPPDDLAKFRAVAQTSEFVRLRALEDRVITSTEPAQGTGAGAATGRGNGAQGRPATGRVEAPARSAIPVDPQTWRTTADAADAKLFAFENAVLDSVTERATGIAVGVFLRLAVAGGLGLIALIASAYIAYRIARRLLRECRTLAARVVDFTQLRLPMLAQQVRDGDPADPADELPDVDYRINEIRQIADSFNRARDAVMVAAAGEVAARQGISEVFVNLARRNQALLHRQLSLLDTMERRTEDPSELGDLFRLDHLATRMRRHAEGLVILAGKSAGRGWRRPVPLVDVVRGAVAEVEDYPRVRVEPLPRLALRGAAVTDVIHLLAEIVENATAYSPPTAPVRIAGHPVASGFVVEVEDRGLGMSPEQVERANARLLEPPEFDPSDSAQLGLFVVARLARRHDVLVTLRPSPYGGTTAIVLIPTALIAEVDEPEPGARRTHDTGPMRALPSNAGAEPGREGSNGVVRLVAEPAPPRPVREPPAALPVPAEAERERVPEPVPQAEPVPAPQSEPVPRAEAEPPPAPDLANGGLPKRRRQAHLAPQLKERVDADLAAQRRADGAAQRRADGAAQRRASVRTPAEPLAAPVPPGDQQARPDEDPARSPEAMRSMMTAMQRGWQRGRDEAAQAEQEDS